MEKILLVDDVKLFLEMQKDLLSSSYVQLLTAGNGLEALTIARKELPDLIITDNNMPVMDGTTCCQEIRKDEQLKHIPVIMISNASKEADIQKYLSIGFNEIISKPIESKLYLATIRKYVTAVERRGARLPFCVPATIITKAGTHDAQTIDISPKGLQLSSKLTPLQNDLIEISFNLPGNDFPLEACARVAWVKLNQDKSGPQSAFGVEITKITGKGIPFVRKSELENFVKSLQST